jgi:hypothetical protein
MARQSAGMSYRRHTLVVDPSITLCTTRLHAIVYDALYGIERSGPLAQHQRRLGVRVAAS